MAAQRRIDVVMESVRRLIRMGATPNLLNLLQKQHPADLAQIFSELHARERHAAFNTLVEKNGKLAMETWANSAPTRAPSCWRQVGRDTPPRQEIPSDDAPS
jgi:magnesium transporter